MPDDGLINGIDASTFMYMERRFADVNTHLNDCASAVQQSYEQCLSDGQDLKREIEGAVTTAFHELIDFLRHNDIQALDETEFACRLHDLLFQEQDKLQF